MAAEGETKPVVAEEAEKKTEAPAATENAAAETKPAAEEPKADAAEAPAEDKAEPKKEVKEPKPNVHKLDFEKDVVYLYQFSRTPLLPSLSPYCLKVETWLRLTGLKYENVDHKTKFRSKKGQLPFVELNGEEVADSALIIKDLSTKFEKDLDAALTPEQKLVSHATISMIENHLIFVVAHWRSKHPDLVIKGYKLNLQHALGTKLPNGILNFIFKIHFGRKLAKKVKAQGLGVHSAEEIEEFGKQDLKVLSDLLADKPFFFGDEPTSLDIVAFSVLAQIYFLAEDVKYSLREYLIENCQNLVGLISRIKERSFSDWDEICNTLDLNAHLPKPEPEKKENKEGDNTEKIAEQDKNESELEKDKDKSDEKTEKTENKDDNKEEAK